MLVLKQLELCGEEKLLYGCCEFRKVILNIGALVS